MSRLPALARWILARVLPPCDRDAVLGDLDEEFNQFVAPGRNAAAARWWYARQALGSVPHALRLRSRARRHGSRAGSRGSRLPLPLAQELRYAARAIARRPGFATAVVLTCALAIGVATAVTSLAHAILVEPLPMRPQIRIGVRS
jgi:hypothetical protein